MRRTVGLTLLLVVLAIGVGVGVAWATFPSQSDLQRMSFESLGIDPSTLNIPIVKQIIDDTTAPMQHKLAHEARVSAIEGGAAALGVALVGAVLIELDRRHQPKAPPGPGPSSLPPPT